MKIIMIILAVCVLLVIQSALIPYIRILNAGPDLLLLGVIFWSSGKKRWQGALMGFFCGLLQDLTIGDIAGIFAFTKTLAGYTAAWIPWRPDEGSTFMVGLVLFSAGFMHHFPLYLFSTIESAGGFGLLFLRYGIVSLLYTVVLGMVLYTAWNGAVRLLHRDGRD